MPQVSHILETSLYVDDLNRSEQFYCQLFGFRAELRDDRMRALSMASGQMLLLFERGKSSSGEDTPGGHIPGHDGGGALHLALAIEPGDVGPWRKRLSERNVEVISHVRPEQGGESLYFRDPDGHLIELATPSIWNI